MALNWDDMTKRKNESSNKLNWDDMIRRRSAELNRLSWDDMIARHKSLDEETQAPKGLGINTLKQKTQGLGIDKIKQRENLMQTPQEQPEDNVFANAAKWLKDTIVTVPASLFGTGIRLR